MLCRRIEFVLVLSVCLECRYLVHFTNTRDGQYHGLTALNIVHEESLLETRNEMLWIKPVMRRTCDTRKKTMSYDEYIGGRRKIVN
jgi:hypothetical protein